MDSPARVGSSLAALIVLAHLALGAGAAWAQDPLPESYCKALEVAFQSRLAAATYACTQDSDCSNRPGGIEGTGCGSVVDKTTAQDLFAIYTVIQRDCGLAFLCAPEISIPVCVGGRCQQRLSPPESQITPPIEGDRLPPHAVIDLPNDRYLLEVYVHFDHAPSDAKAAALREAALAQVNDLVPCFANEKDAKMACLELTPAGRGKIDVDVSCIPMRNNRPEHPDFVACINEAVAQWRIDGLRKRDGLSVYLNRVDQRPQPKP